MRLPILLGLLLSFLAPALTAQRGLRNDQRPEGPAPRHTQREMPAPRPLRDRIEAKRPGARALQGRHEQVRQRVVERLRGRIEEMRREHRRDHLRQRMIEHVRTNRAQKAPESLRGQRGGAPELRQRIEQRLRERMQSERRAPEAKKPEVGVGKGQKKRRIVAE